MPRRKKATAKPLGELLGVRMPSNDRENLFRVLDDLPPLAYWAQCRTKDQAEHLLTLEQGYQFLKEEIARYFGGAGSLIPRLEAKDRDFFYALREHYLSWYTVVQLGWIYITDELQQAGLTLEDIQAHSPGEALARIIENECAAFVQLAFLPYTRYSPSADRKLAETQSAIEKGQADEKTVARYERTVAKNNRDTAQFFAMTHGMVEICERHSGKIEGLGDAIKRYKIAIGGLNREVSRHHHKRQKRKGHEWKNGKKQALSKG